MDFNHRKNGGNMGVNHGYLHLQNRHNSSKTKRIRLSLHELLHGQGFSWPCTKGDDGTHVNGPSILSNKGGHYVLGDMIYDHDEKGCPDLKDSVYLTPTSKNPYDPLPLMCNLAKRSGRGRPNWNFNWPKRYDHEKFDESDTWKKRYYCNYKFSEYAYYSWFKDWCPSGRINAGNGNCK